MGVEGLSKTWTTPASSSCQDAGLSQTISEFEAKCLAEVETSCFASTPESTCSRLMGRRTEKQPSLRVFVACILSCPRHFKCGNISRCQSNLL